MGKRDFRTRLNPPADIQTETVTISKKEYEDLTQRIGGEKYMKLVKPEPEDSIIDTMLQVENEMAIGK